MKRWQEHFRGSRRKQRQPTTLDGALAFARQGLHVFPCRPHSKQPLFSKAEGGSGHLDATTDETLITRWWTQHADANIGVACEASGIIVIDVDPRNGGDVTLAQLVEELGPLPPTVEVETGGGGEHYYFQDPGGSLRSTLGLGVDVKRRGYVVAPPSVHPSGAVYRWRRPPSSAAVAALPPSWVRALVRTPEVARGAVNARLSGVTSVYGRAALVDEVAKVSQSSEGERNTTLNTAAFVCAQLCGGGEVAEAEAKAELMEAARAAGLPAAEATGTIESGWTAGLKQPRSAPEQSTANDLLAPLRALDEKSSPDAVSCALREFGRGMAAVGKVERAAHREAAVALLKHNNVSGGAKIVDAAMPTEVTKESGGGGTLVLADPDPWPDLVDGAVLLDEIETLLLRFVVLPPGTVVIISLWVLLTYVFDEFEVCPLLVLHSPTMRCGKTRTLSLLGGLVARPLPVSNISTAALFRVVDGHHPTLLIDEADAFASGNDELRGILNSGHTRSGAYVIRTVGDDHEPRHFSTWGPKAVALIGRLAATLMDRALVVSMARRKPTEEVEQLRLGRVMGELEPLRRRAARWARDNREALRSLDPTIPTTLGSDRAADNAGPLLAIAEQVGDVWTKKAREAFVSTLGQEKGNDEQAGIVLLGDLRDLFATTAKERLSTKGILASLHDREDRPWPEWSRGKPLSAAALAKLLLPFGVLPTRGKGPQDPRGYFLADLQEAFLRYLPGNPSHPPTDGDNKQNGNPTPAHNTLAVAGMEDRNSSNPRHLADGADRHAGKGMMALFRRARRSPQF